MHKLLSFTENADDHPNNKYKGDHPLTGFYAHLTSIIYKDQNYSSTAHCDILICSSLGQNVD